jgi:hypothetical protein
MGKLKRERSLGSLFDHTSRSSSDERSMVERVATDILPPPI